ncbi:MAG: anion permease [Planctomycetes bacterium]|nr:anion permease [Planctomycetota bacterium]
MNSDIALLLGILFVAAVLFSRERISPDIVGLGVMLALILTGLLPAERAFAGFGSDTVMLILGLLILTAALVQTGVVDRIGHVIARRSGADPSKLLLVILIACAGLSSFMSNTAATALFVPLVFGIARRSKVAPGALLLPLAFASILASSVTLVSSSTNLVVSGILQQYGQAPLGMFELTLVGLPIAVIGIAYMMTLGKRLIPARAQATDTLEHFGLRPFLAEIIAPAGSPLVGKSLEALCFAEDFGLQVLRITRSGKRSLSPNGKTVLEADDVLLVEGSREEILRIKAVAGIEIKADFELSDPDLQSEDIAFVEVLLLPGSRLIGRTLRGVRLSAKYGVQVLAVQRQEQRIAEKISRLPLRLGDVLLIQGPRDIIATLDREGIFRTLTDVEIPLASPRRGWIAVGIFAAAILLPALGILSLPVSALLGALAAFVFGCITPEEAYAKIEWKVIVLIGCILSLGAAMNSTGADRWMADIVVDSFGEYGGLPLLGGFFLLTVLLTQAMSNQAAAVVVLPIAIQTALHLGLNPRTFAVGIAVAASCSFLTPLEPSCLMVYGPGRYRFLDFPRVGAPLTLLIFAIALVLVPWLWPFA